MDLKLEDVVPYSLAVKSLFDANKDAVIAFDPSLDAPFESSTWAGEIAAVEGMIGTRGLISLKKGDRVVSNGYMDGLTPMIGNLEYKIGLCRDGGSITDSLASFDLGALKRSIRRRNVAAFHASFVIMMARVLLAGNKAALIGKGFLFVNMTAMSDQHDLVWNMNTVKIDLKVEIHALSAGNRLIVAPLMKTNQRVINALQALGKSTGNRDLMKLATGVAIKRTVVPTVGVKAVNRVVKMNTSICWLENPAMQDLLQLTLITKGGSVSVCRMDSKTGECSDGIVLDYNTMISLKKMDIPGSGDCIIITNFGDGTVKVRVLRIKG